GENGRSDVRTRSYGHLSAHRAPPARRNRPSGSRDDVETVWKIANFYVDRVDRGRNDGIWARKRWSPTYGWGRGGGGAPATDSARWRERPVGQPGGS